MAYYTDVSPVSRFDLTGNDFIDSLYDPQDYFRNGWSTQVNGKTSVSFSFVFEGGADAYFIEDYGDEITATTYTGVTGPEIPGIVKAFQAWAKVANISFNRVTEDDDGNVGDIRIGFSSAVGEGFWGHTKIQSDGYNNAHGDIWISPDYLGDSFAPETYNYLSIMHEIGHALGLDHPFQGNIIPEGYDNQRYTIMSYTDPENVYHYNLDTGEYDYLVRSPMVFDIAAIQLIYGPNTRYNTGNNTYVYTPDDPFFESIWDAGGQDTIDLSAFNGACLVTIAQGGYSSMTFDDVALDQNLGIAFGCKIENVIGGKGDDVIEGNALANRIEGGSGADVLSGLANNDVLAGGAGRDTEKGGKGDDTFLLGKDGGNDRIDGGLDIDLADYRTALAAVTVDLSVQQGASRGAGDAAGVGIDTLSGIENVAGSAFGDNITGDGAANRIDGGKGADTLFGLGAADVLIGGGGDDSLAGGSGADRIVGGTGRDSLTGGAGGDRFVFDDGDVPGTTATTADRITDFSRAAGDRIDLSAMDAIASSGANNAFTFIGKSGFGHVAGQLRYGVAGGTAFVYGDTNGDAVADFAIRVENVSALLAADFVL